MKKIILFLALALGVKVNAQVVGGYLPVNSTKSATVGALRVNGALTATGTITGGSLKTGSTTIIGGASNATLTGGNTGTVAVLSDAVFAYNFQVASAVNPNDATSYYFSNLNNPTWLTSASANSILMPYNATLIGYHINYLVNGVTGTAETATLQISASGSATNLVTTLDFQGASNSYTSNALSLPVVAGTLISAVLATPTWVTNPTNIRMGITFLFVRRS